RRREEQKRKEEEKAAKAQAAAAKAAAGRCPEGMVEIAGGAFPMGSAGNDSARDTWEKKLEPTDVKTFCIDQYEFPGKKGEAPRAGVTWEQARALCSGRGKRLCTEAEWEKACKGAAGGRYPYGNQYDGGSCNTKGAGRQLSPSGSFAGCKSDYNVFDMSGNVKEWTSSDWSDVVQDKAVRGGSYSRPDWATRCAFRENIRPDQSDSQIGFRCCQ
ncbi:MAG: formylglycine-generating enzyme family protein, partial [Bdellovibrionota bacterium]